VTGLWLALALVASAGAGTPAEGQIAIAPHRGERTFLYIARISELPPGLRQRLLEPALPQALPAEPGVDSRAVLSPLPPLGTPFARWSGRRVQGFAGQTPVCVKSVRRLVLYGAIPGAGGDAEPPPEAMARALAEGVVAGEVSDAEGACRRADWFHDPDLGPLPVADGTSVETSSPAGRDELYGGIGRLRLQPDWVRWQADLLARRRASDAGSGPVSWDGEGARGAHYALGQSPFVAAASTSPDCTRHLALLFHAMNQPILIWPFLSYDSPQGTLPGWVADVGGLWPVAYLDGALLAPEGDHYRVVQRFPGTPTQACPKAP
jgi:hypothetical protein